MARTGTCSLPLHVVREGLKYSIGACNGVERVPTCATVVVDAEPIATTEGEQ